MPGYKLLIFIDLREWASKAIGTTGFCGILRETSWEILRV
jgi:hypothetical protein